MVLLAPTNIDTPPRLIALSYNPLYTSYLSKIGVIWKSTLSPFAVSITIHQPKMAIKGRERYIVGVGGGVWKSSNSKDWDEVIMDTIPNTEGSNKFSNDGNVHLHYDGTQFIAFGSALTNVCCIWTSTDNCVTWISRRVISQSNPIQFVDMLVGSTHYILVTNKNNGVGNNGYFYIPKSNVAFSTPYVQQNVYPIMTNGTYKSGTYASGVFYICSTESVNGFTISDEIPSSPLAGFAFPVGMRPISLCYDSITTKFVVIGQKAIEGYGIAYSSNGATWIDCVNPLNPPYNPTVVTVYPRVVSLKRGGFAAYIDDDLGINNFGLFVYSPDGENWTRVLRDNEDDDVENVLTLYNILE